MRGFAQNGVILDETPGFSVGDRRRRHPVESVGVFVSGLLDGKDFWEGRRSVYSTKNRIGSWVGVCSGS